jgi:hypothetical protein
LAAVNGKLYYIQMHHIRYRLHLSTVFYSLRGARSTLVGSGDGSSTAANELLASGRLNALFQNLDG